MGAWGSGSFENDTAMDWAAQVQSVDDVRKPFERLKRDTDATSAKLVLDADFACELIAAAECVALMMGRPSRDFPDDLARRLANAAEPDNLLFHQARNAVLHSMRKSELAELWQESAKEGDPNEWLKELTGLIDRLNPDVEPSKFSPPSVAPPSRSPTDVVGTCAFCNQGIQRQELWGMHVYDAEDPGRAGKKSYWLHLACLNARMHHKHAIADFKFEPGNFPKPGDL